jgi:hypothetical protein
VHGAVTVAPVLYSGLLCGDRMAPVIDTIGERASMGRERPMDIKQDWVQEDNGVWRITVAGERDLRLINNRIDHEGAKVTDLVLAPRT